MNLDTRHIAGEFNYVNGAYVAGDSRGNEWTFERVACGDGRKTWRLWLNRAHVADMPGTLTLRQAKVCARATAERFDYR